MNDADLRRVGRAAFPGFVLRRLARTPSTQDAVRGAASAGAPAGFCCVAAEQSAGRGRQGRTWSAPAGSALLMSILLRPSRRARSGVTLAAGLAVVDAVGDATGVMSGLKWPNDVLVEGRKLAGILAEGLADGCVVLGVGLNLTVPSFPAHAAGISLHQVTSRPPGWAAMLAALLPRLARRLDDLEGHGVAGLRPDWERVAVGLGRPVTAREGTKQVAGIACGIDDDGALVVETSGGPVRLTAGEVHLVT